MYEVEIWIDVACRTGDRYETMCTLFANLDIPMRPMIGETLSFYPSKGSSLGFNLVSSIGIARQSSVNVTVDDVGHYAVKNENGILFKTSIRCSEILVASEEDARTVCELLISQIGFSFDPYATNKIETIRGVSDAG